jgi:hypothetical protein
VTLAALRNHHGEVLTSISCFIDHVMDAPLSEALAIKNGLELAGRHGCSMFTVESDCLEIVQACNCDLVIWSPYSSILVECFHFACRIGSVSFTQCPRKANNMAHSLARKSYDTNCVYSWDGDPPKFLLAELICDVTII